MCARSTRSPSTNCLTKEPLQLEPPHIFREKMRLFTSPPRLVPCTPCICGARRVRCEPVIGTRRHLRGDGNSARAPGCGEGRGG